MTGFTTIAPALFAVGKPITSAIGLALYDNPVAMAASDAGAPVTQVGWHPYDSTVNGTGVGLIYDFAVSGAVSFLESPLFANGYEYAFLCTQVSSSTAPDTFQVAMYRATSAAYAAAGPLYSAITPASLGLSGMVEARLPMRVAAAHSVTGFLQPIGVGDGTTTATGGAQVAVFSHSTAQKLSKAKFSFVSGSIDGGTIHMYRRRID